MKKKKKKKKRLNGYVYDFPVGIIDSNIIDIHQDLMKKQDIN